MSVDLSVDQRLRTIVDGLSGRKSGSSWMAKCPSHVDRNPSLAVRVRGGKVLVHCHAGCSQADVLSALRRLGLWNQMRDHPEEWGTLVASYDYRDEQGRLLYQVCRFVPKTFRPRRPDGRGGWLWGYGQVRRVLYHLLEVLDAPIVFVTEGEKDVESLRGKGLVATTNAGGANAPWLPAYTDTLRGRHVILIPDNDPPGQKRVLKIANALVGHVARLSILELEHASDITEWFDHGHSELELLDELEVEHAT